MDVLAYIASDPTVLPLWAAFLFAAGMYPIGLIFGCSACCSQNPCNLCTDGQLPDTITVSLQGFQDKVPGTYLCGVSVESCFGSGAAGLVTGPGGDPDDEDAYGPIEGVTVTNGGSGYAILGREEPEVLATAFENAPGSGAELSVVLDEVTGNCGIPHWEVDAITVTSSGDGYSDGQDIHIYTINGGTEETQATAIINAVREEPVVHLVVDTTTGADAVLVPVFEQIPGVEPKLWRLDSVTVSSGGTGYADFEAVSVSVDEGGGTTVQEATAEIRTVFEAPSVTATVSSAEGTGATLSVTLRQKSLPHPWQHDEWEIDTISVSEGGSGYADGDQIEFFVDVGEGGALAVVTVDEAGAVTGASIVNRGTFFHDTGVIESVSVTYGGEYYKLGDSGAIDSITVTNRGSYYKEDASLPPIAGNVTVTLGQDSPSNGSGAALSAEIDTDTSSETFGQITAINVDNGGDGYLAFTLVDNYLKKYDGRTLVMSRVAYPIGNSVYPQPANYPNEDFYGYDEIFVNSWDDCVYTYKCKAYKNYCLAENEILQMEYLGPGQPSRLWIRGLQYSGYCQTPTPTTPMICGGVPFDQVYNRFSKQMLSDSEISDCSTLESDSGPVTFVFPDDSGTATVTPGGDYEEPDVCQKLYQSELRNVKMTLEWDGQTFESQWFPFGQHPNQSQTETPLCALYASDGGNPEACGGFIGLDFTLGTVCDGPAHATGSKWIYQAEFTLDLDNSKFPRQWVIGGSTITRTAVVWGPSWPNDIMTWLPIGPAFGYSYSMSVPPKTDENGYPTGEVYMKKTGGPYGSPFQPQMIPPEAIKITLSSTLP